jgi:hypothetical protein
MSKISKFVKLHKDVLLEYVYNDGNLISEPYNILVNSRDQRLSYMSVDSSGTGNSQGNQLFKLDSIANKYGKVNPSFYSFLQVKNYSAGIPVRHDTIKFHIPINWTFGEYLGFYIRVYTFDTTGKITYDLSNFYFDMTDVSQQNLMNFTSPPLLFQEKLWGKNITIEIPSVSELSSQRVNNRPRENSINANLTTGNGLSLTSPIFIDFHFITNIQTINGISNYLLTTKTTTTISQNPEFERLGLVVKESINGDFFEVYGTYNDTLAEFKKFIDDAVNLGNRYYVQYSITMYEQNIRGKTTTVTVTDNFNETIEYRPIIKYSTTTAIIDVEMRLIDSVDESYIVRRASYGMLQDQVSKYSLSMMKINLKNAYKPKIYNIKNQIDPSLIGNVNALGMLGEFGIGGNKNNNNLVNELDFGDGSNDGSNGRRGRNRGGVQTIKIPFPVLVEKFNVIGKSENTTHGKNVFYGIGKLMINIFPFDNIVSFALARGIETKPEYLDLNGLGEIKLSFKNDNTFVEFPLYTETESINLAIGQVVFKVSKNKFNDIKRIYSSGINLFYITATNNGISTVIYTGLYKVYDSQDNVRTLNSNIRDVKGSGESPTIIKDPNIGSAGETAIVTRRISSGTANKKPNIDKDTKSGGKKNSPKK